MTETQTLDATEATGGTLKWKEEDGRWYAANTANVRNHPDSTLAYFWICKDGAGLYYIGDSDGILLPLSVPGPFGTLEEAQDACEHIDDVLRGRLVVAILAEREKAPPAPATPPPTPPGFPELSATLSAVVRGIIGRKPNPSHDPQAEAIATLQGIIADLQRVTVKLRDSAKELKEHLDFHGAEYDRLCREQEQAKAAADAPAPLFDNPDFRQPAATPNGEHSSHQDAFEGAGTPSDTPGDPDTAERLYEAKWRAVKLGDLNGIKPAKVKAMAENDPPIRTLGELSDWQKVKGDRWARYIKGMGAGGSEQIEKAAEVWFKANPAPAGKAPPAPGKAIVTPESLDYDPGAIAVTCEGHLLTAMQAGKVPVVGATVWIGGDQYLCTPAPAGYDADVYALRPLLEMAPSVKPGGTDAYVGGQVKHHGREWFIGPFADAILVRDAGGVA